MQYSNNTIAHELQPTLTAMQRLLTSQEAAKLLNVSERTLWALMKAGEITHVRFGRTVRYTQHDLEAFIEANKSQAGQTTPCKAVA